MPITPNPATTEWVPVWDLNGPSGVSSFLLKYIADTTSTTNSYPGAGKIRWNNFSQFSSTVLYISKLTDGGADATAVLETMSSNDQLVIQSRSTGEDNQVWRVSGPVISMSGGWVVIPVTFVNSNGSASFVNNQQLAIIVKTAGPSGVPTLHHTTHEIGGSDVIQDVAWTNQPNIFTKVQKIALAHPSLEIQYVTNPTISRIFQAVPTNRTEISTNLLYDGSNWIADDPSQISFVYSQNGGEHGFYYTTITPNPRTVIQLMSITPTGTYIPAGLGATPLNASNLTTGTVPLARLPYEEGSFTPVLGGTGGESGQVYMFQSGNYVKIGNFVHAGIYIQFSNNGIINGNLVVKGLPYAGGGGSATHAASIGYITNLGSPGTVNPRRSVHAYLLGNSTFISLFSGDDINSINMIEMTGLDTNIHTQLILSISYRTNY